MKYLLLICILYPLSFLAQEEEAGKYLKLYERYRDEKKYDSVVIICKQLIALDKSITKEHHLEYQLAYAAFESKQYDLAVKQAKKLIPNIYIQAQAHWNRKCLEKNMRCRILCSELTSYYNQTGNVKKEYRYLSLMVRKFNCAGCGTGRSGWYISGYNRMIACSNELGKTKRAKRLEKQRDKIE